MRILLVGIPLSWVFGWLYALAAFNTSFLPLTLIELMFFALALTMLSGSVLEAGHSRSRRVDRLAGFVIGLSGLWAHWIVTLKAYGPGQAAAVQFASSGPATWIHVVAELALRLREQNPHAGSMLMGWGIEAVVVVGMSAWLAEPASRRPYSEAARAWAEKDAHGELWPSRIGPDDLSPQLQAYGVRTLLAMRRAIEFGVQQVSSEWWTVSVEGFWVESDPDARWLNVAIVTQTREANGTVKTTRQAVVESWQVSDQDYRDVMTHLATSEPHDVVRQDDLAPEKSEKPTTPELTDAIEALGEGRHDDVLKLASPHAANLLLTNLAVRADANRLCALALSHDRRHAEALSYWKVLDDLEPTAHNLHQVASSAAMLGDVSNAERWFDEALQRAEAEHQEGERSAAPMMVANFVTALHEGGASRAAFERLKLLGGWYAGLHITDTTFVDLRGMPFFSTFVERSAPVVRAVIGEVDAEAWYRSIYDAVDDDGRAALFAGRKEWGLA